MSESIFNYFPLITNYQKEQLTGSRHIYERWNNKINVISRKDMDNFMIHHVLHSLSIAKIISFLPGTRILDVGTGGGFPGIPLAILFPEAEFTLLDSIEKKIKVVKAVAEELKLKNVIPLRKRVEDEKNKYDFVISRAITSFPEFVNLTAKNIRSSGSNILQNGIFCLKGGDLREELLQFKDRIIIRAIKDHFKEPFFETKVIVYLPV